MPATRGKYLDSLQLGVQGPGPVCVLTRSLKGSGGSGGCGAFSGSRPDCPMVGGHFPGGRKRISLSCERLRALLPQFDGRREDMASVLEMSVQFLRLASALVPGWEKHAVSCPAAALSALWEGAVGIPPYAPGSSDHPAAWLLSALRLALPGLLRFCRHASVCAQHLLREPRGQAVFSIYVPCIPGARQSFPHREHIFPPSGSSATSSATSGDSHMLPGVCPKPFLK